MTYVVLTTMKNEAAFLLDWVAHHKALGFDSLVICTNDCSDGTDAMVLRLQEMGLARHHPTRRAGTSIQRAAFRQARKLPQIAGAEWLWVCDADEYLVVHAGDGSARALVAAGSEAVEVISVPWRVFGPDGRVGYHDRPVAEQFVLAERGARRGEGMPVFAKSLLRGPAGVGRIGVHAPVPPEGAMPYRREAPGGRAVRPGQPMMVRARYDVAQVNHYVLRSAESFLVKRDRGRVNHVGEDMGQDYWRRFNRGEVEDRSIRRYAPAVADWRQRLMADARLAELHAAAVVWHRARIAALRADPGMAALWAVIGGGA
ncbi:MAG: glycosyltransferase family 2 protein [Paracoccaceae bacterium]